jgi:hypothetical protein
MKKIPTFEIFNKQEFGGNWDTIQQCLEYTALYMHTWNLFEWVVANIIAADANVNDNKSVEDIWAHDLIADKCKKLRRITTHGLIEC